jgi:two-component system phosphate regulon sensor histidine kinase PhoR
VKHALARHQASLEVESKQGSGSRFAVRFPASRTVPAETGVVSDRG